jgi:nucleoside-diphosphate-sugar epimerase
MNIRGQISILGCGWLGLELAKTLLNQGFKVKGSTRTKKKVHLLESQGIEPFLIDLSEQGVLGEVEEFVANSEVLILNLPPGLRGNPGKNHLKEIQFLVAKLRGQGLKQLIYVSSTSVYKDRTDLPEIFNHSKPDADSLVATQLQAIETFLLAETEWQTSILRPGGLFGPQRHPAKALSGRSGIKNPLAPINLIHQKDVIHCLIALLKRPLESLVLNAVYPYHPNKKTYYQDYCRLHDLKLPEFDESAPSKGKVVNSLNTVLELSIKFDFKP